MQFVGSFCVDVADLKKRSEAVKNHLNMLKVRNTPPPPHLHTVFTPLPLHTAHLFTPLHLLHPMHLIKSLHLLCSCNTCKPFIPCTLAPSKTLRRLTVCTYSLHSKETLHPLQPYQPLDTNLLYPLYLYPLDALHPCTLAPLCTSCTPTALFVGTIFFENVIVIDIIFLEPLKKLQRIAGVHSHCWDRTLDQNQGSWFHSDRARNHRQFFQLSASLQ